jgi:hypothetical protein
MSCKTCPHHVKHGKPAKDGKSIVFTDRCGLEREKKTLCKHFPFGKSFIYRTCDIYHKRFGGGADRNDVNPTKDVQYAPQFVAKGNLAEMDYL